jgi:hypothetical protein
VKKYTFFYVVGGDDCYYNQLAKSIRSLKRLKCDFDIKILDFNEKLSSENNIQIINSNKSINQKHIFWQYKYFITQQLDTEYGIYLDCDTIICEDRLEEIFDRLTNKFGVVQHFYLNNFTKFLYAFPSETSANFINKYSINLEDKFYTGGVFLFKNDTNSFNILKDTFDMHNQYYLKETDYIEGLYDETFLSTVLKKYNYLNLNGAINHCCANHMPLKLSENKLIGKNPFDLKYEDIFVLHGYSDRQTLGLDFEGDLKRKIQEMWNI